MKAKQQRFKCYPISITFFLLTITTAFNSINAQCPTVTNSTQTLCDLQSVLVGDLEATDNGGGIVWYASADSTTPLSNSAGLISGEDYYADDNTGSCGTRARVDFTLIGPPTGNNFQGVCLDDVSQATVSSLIATGNDVQWYSSPAGGTPLDGSDILVNSTLYYADQASPDGSCRTSRLPVLVIVGSTSIPTGDMVQNFCSTSGSTPTVGDLVASGNNNWYISLFSALPLSPSTPLISGQTYYATTLDPPCESTGRLAVLAILDTVPDAGENGILDICDNNLSSTFDLFLSLEGSPETGGSWSPTLNSGTGIFDPNIDPVGEYTYTVASNNTCPDGSASVTISIIPAPNAGTSANLDLCSIDAAINLFDSLGGNPEAGGVWSPSLNSGTGVFNPAIDSDGIYTYTVTGTGPCADATATITVSVTEYKDAGENGSIDVCDNVGIIDLFDSLGGIPDIGGVWSPALTSGTGFFDPLIDSAGTYTYSFIGNDPCPNESATVSVNVVPLPIAGSDATLTLCSNDLAAVDLFDSLGGTPQPGGSWSPTLTSNTGVFDPSTDTAGIYTYTVSGTPPCTDISAEVNVIIIQEPNAGINATVNICSNNGTIDLFDSLGGNPEVGGTWSPTLTSGTGIFDPLVDPIGNYNYTVTGTSPCADATATVTISIIPFQNAGTDGAVTVCSNDGTIDLFDSLGGIPEVGGTWSPTLTSGTGIFNPAIDLADTYTYTTSGTGPCSDDEAIVEVSVIPAPDAGIDATINICDNIGLINLFDNLGGTPETGGTWFPALTSGTNIFDPLVDTVGDYTYTVTGTSPCADDTATILITVVPFQNAGTDGTVTACTNDGTIDLFNSLGGSPQSGGIWTPTLNSTTGVFDPLIDAAGTYTYTTSGSGPCSEDEATVEVSIEISPDAGLDGTLNLCSLANSVDLFSSLGGLPQTGGTWSPALASGTGVFDPNLDPEGDYIYTISSAICNNSTATITVSVTDANDAGNNGNAELCFNDAPINLFNSLGGNPDIGGTWTPLLNSGTGMFDPTVDSAGTYMYTVSNSTNLCPDDTATVLVTVLQEPNAGNNGTLNLCDATITVDLINGLGGTAESGGTWSPTLTSGTGIFDPNTDPEGIYTYTLTNSCGTNSATVTVSLSDVNDAGDNGTIELCGTDSFVDLFNSLGGNPDIGGTWSPTLTSGTGVFDPSVDAAGEYTYTVSSGTTACPNDSATVTVTVLQGPDVGSNGTLNLCDTTNTIDLLTGLSGTPEIGGTWSPTLDSGTGIFDPNFDPEGIYTYTLTNSCGTNSATVTVSLSDVNDAGDNGTIELCGTDASVDLFNSLGGNPDIGGTWSPTLTSGTGVFDPSIDIASVYTYTVSSGTAACPNDSATVTVSVLQGPDAGNNGTLNLCDTTNTIDLINGLAGTPETGGTWSPALISGTGIFDPNSDPEGTYTYTLSNACGTNSATVTVSLSDVNDAGDNGTVEFCNTDTSVDLFNSLGGNPDIGGTWTPILTSGTGVFDPSIDTAGVYTYTVSSGTAACPNDSATVTVSILQGPDAGSNGTLNLCGSTNTVNLFDSLTGTPETGGVWSPALTSGTNIYDPNTDTAIVYTYTVSNSCGNSSATVTISSDSADAGDNGNLEICITDMSVNLFNSLQGSPDSGGTWTPTLTSGTGVFNPSIDTAGVYTYTVSSSTTACPNDTATVTVSVLQVPDAGSNGTLNLCNSTNTVNLFDILTGTPETGGIWSPALTSGTNIYDPSTDTAETYTYTVSNTCGSSSSTVTISSDSADAGDNGNLEICITDSPLDLFNSLGGTPDMGGTWSPTLTSTTGVFDPTIDSSGIYTYTVTSASASCPDDFATVTVSVLQLPNAGTDALLDICLSDATVTANLTDALLGSPDTGGTWSPTLTSGTGIFDPNTDTVGTYTYTVSNSCGTSSAEVTVSTSNPNDAGIGTSIELCSNATAINLFESLEGTPNTTGTWSPALNSGTGLFDPAIDSAGTYTYTVSDSTSSCPAATASIEVSIIATPNAGIDSSVLLCIDETNTINLFESLEGNPDVGGTWSPALTSGSGIFDPTIDNDGIYTYSVTSTECNITVSANVTVTILDLPDVTGLTMSMEDNVICVGLEDAIIDITGANQLPDGDYSIVYQLSDANVSVNTIAISILGGNATFTIPQVLLENSGLTIVNLNQLFVLGQSCSAITTGIDPVKIIVEQIPTPILIDNGTEFCLEDNSTLNDLSNNITNVNYEDGEIVIWYDQLTDGTQYNNSEVLEEGIIYYASIRSAFGCESEIRLEATVSFIECIGDLVIPDGFSPNNDGINDVFDILFLEDLYPNYKVSVYNRYGNILYEGNKNTPQWDGTWKNNSTVLPVGVYFYIIEFNDGETEPVQGRVYLSR